MPSVITTTDLSVEDKSELKTGNTRRRHDMPGKQCDMITDPVEREKCLNYQGGYAKKNTGAAPAKKAPMSSGIKKSGY